jgi:hypothetical protein
MSRLIGFSLGEYPVGNKCPFQLNERGLIDPIEFFEMAFFDSTGVGIGFDITFEC